MADDVVKSVENVPVLVQHPVRMISFQKVITKYESKVGQTLPLPRKFIQEFVLKSWEELILQVHDGRSYSCKLLWRLKSEKKDCHLGKKWYNLVQDMALSRGDKVVFETIENGLNRLNVKIIHRGN
ncbi:DNA-binding barrel domain superfamily [Sesbania bispinosa]|nr:DNA-binding barrel domain superfamily [Sesbania bispinosa]